MVDRRILLLLDVLCLLGVLWAAGLIGLLLSGRQVLPTGVAVGVTALLVLPGFLVGVVGNRTTFRGRLPRDADTGTIWRPPVDLPRAALAVAGLLLLAFWVAGMTAFAEVDRERSNPAVEQRIALGVLGALGVGGTTIAAAAYRHGKSQSESQTGSQNRNQAGDRAHSKEY